MGVKIGAENFKIVTITRSSLKSLIKNVIKKFLTKKRPTTKSRVTPTNSTKDFNKFMAPRVFFVVGLLSMLSPMTHQIKKSIAGRFNAIENWKRKKF